MYPLETIFFPLLVFVNPSQFFFFVVVLLFWSRIFPFFFFFLCVIHKIDQSGALWKLYIVIFPGWSGTFCLITHARAGLLSILWLCPLLIGIYISKQSHCDTYTKVYFTFLSSMVMGRIWAVCVLVQGLTWFQSFRWRCSNNSQENIAISRVFHQRNAFYLWKKQFTIPHFQKYSSLFCILARCADYSECTIHLMIQMLWKSLLNVA